MDHSFFISRTSSNSSTASSHQHITISRKLHEISRRVQYAKRIIKEEGALTYGGCTYLRAGPPSFLRGSAKDKWIKDIRACTNTCVWRYLLPAYSDKIEYYKSKIKTDIIDKITDENREIIERGIQLGRDRANRKWDRREGIKKDNRIAVTPILGNFREEEIGLIKRGELQLEKDEELVINHIIKGTEDIFKILAYGIYGSGRYRKMIVRNIWKFIHFHEEEEKEKFKPFLGRLSNNTHKWIHTWSMFCAFIRNRDLLITAFELDIISRLYDVRVKIFRKTDTGLECTWESRIQTQREVNILLKSDNEWLHLIKTKISQEPILGRKEIYRDSNSKESINENCVVKIRILDNQRELVYDNSKDLDEDKAEVNNADSMSIKEFEVSNNDINNLEDDSRINNTNSRNEVEDGSCNQKISDSFIAKLFGENSSQSEQEAEHYASTQNIKDSQGYDKVISRRNIRKKLIWQMWRKKVRDNKRNKERKEDIKLQKEGAKEKNKKLVFDFTEKGLNTTEIELLSKGESFCVNCDKVDEDRLKTDIYNFGRKLRLHDEFREPKREITSQGSSRSNITQTQRNTRGSLTRRSNNLSPITQTPTSIENSNVQQNITQSSMHSNKQFKDNNIRKPISIYDPECQNRNLNRYIQCVQEESLLISKQKTKFRDNITKEHRQAIKSLKDKISKKDIIITKADKGSGLVAVDYNMYIQKGTRYIEEEAKAYEKVSDSEKSIVNKLIKARNNIVQKLKLNKVIEIETATYCNKQLEEKITGLKFYFKIHKDSNIHTMPLRPLQSCINAPTHHLSQVLTDLLQPFLKNSYIPTYLQDSNQLLYKLDKLQQLSTDHTLISSDVAALYPSIPHEEGMLAITEFLQHNSEYSETQIECIIKALELVITENYVVWNSQIYKQTSGVAMGTPVAVAYANIFMHWVDEELQHRAPFIIQHFRYIDDNLFILPTNKIEELMQIANNILRPHIRFTYETLDRQSDVGLSFLDTLLFITEEGKVVSRLFTKKTDKHAYLLPSSYHPRHITKNIPLAVFNRIRRLCSTEEWFQVDSSKAIEWLEDREYKFTDITKALETSMKKDRLQMINNIENKRNIEKNIDTQDDIFNIPFLVTYGHNTQRIREVLKQRENLLDASFVTTTVKPRLTFRRQKNLSDIIVQKSLRGPIESKEEKSIVLCGDKPKYRTVCPCKGRHDQKICRCCAHMKLKVEGIKNKLHKKVDCDTKNIIYLIGCKECSKKYIGETQQKVKERLLQHLGNIGKLTQPLYTHFNQTHAAENLYITILETVKSGEPAYRKVREAWWINRLQTLEPRGFNVKLECNQVYQASKGTIQIERVARRR